MRTRVALDLADCQQGSTAAIDAAVARGWRVTVAIVDDGGALLVLLRMDEASPASVSAAIEKARTAALLGLDTKSVEKMANARPGLMTLDRAAVEGGLPIIADGQRLGGVGVSGRPPHEDAAIASVAVKAISDHARITPDR